MDGYGRTNARALSVRCPGSVALETWVMLPQNVQQGNKYLNEC